MIVEYFFSSSASCQSRVPASVILHVPTGFDSGRQGRRVRHNRDTSLLNAELVAKLNVSIPGQCFSSVHLN